MATCPKCGAVSSGKFCTTCGTLMETESNTQGYSDGSYNAASPEFTQNGVRMDNYASSDPKNYQLGWHKFLIYFALFASGVLNVISAVTWFNAAQYDTLYGIIGVIEILLAVFVVVVRFPLAKFKKGAPKLLLVAYAATAIINIVVAIINISLIAQLSSYGVSMDMSSEVTGAIRNVAVPIAMLVGNWRYYANRKALFIN